MSSTLLFCDSRKGAGVRSLSASPCLAAEGGPFCGVGVFILEGAQGVLAI